MIFHIISSKNKMSAFKNKVKQLKEKQSMPIIKTLQKNILQSKNSCSATDFNFYYSPQHQQRQKLCIKEPIYICKKNQKKEEIKSKKRQLTKQFKVEPFQPIQIPQSPPSGTISRLKALSKNTAESTQCGNKQIQIHIENDDKNKHCLKKLFKKIHTLSNDLANSEKQRIRLQLQLNNLKDIDGFNRNQQRNGMQIEADNFKLKTEIQFLKKQLKDKDKEIAEIKAKTPVQIIKQVIVEKPVEVKVEVPKYVQGPQKIIEVTRMDPKSAQKHQQQINYYRKKLQKLADQLQDSKKKLAQKSNEFSVPAIVEKPVYLEKPIYIEKPVYIEKEKIVEKPIERERVIERPIQVPYEIPVYIEKPIVDEEFLNKVNELQKDIQNLLLEKEELATQNSHLKVVVGHLHSNIQIIKRHNFHKNHEIQHLLDNTMDYSPVKNSRNQPGASYRQAYHWQERRRNQTVSPGITFQPRS